MGLAIRAVLEGLIPITSPTRELGAMMFQKISSPCAESITTTLTQEG